MDGYGAALELTKLSRRTIEMYEIVKDIVGMVKKLTEAQDDEERLELDKQIDDKTSLVDVLREQITEDVLLFILRYQPLGRDFVYVHRLLDVVYDIYRVGRYCREISLADRYALSLNNEDLRSLNQAISIAKEAFEEAFKAFFNGCSECVERVKELDNLMDELYINSLKEVKSHEYVRNSQVVKVLVLRHLERIVDHAVSIAESSY